MRSPPRWEKRRGSVRVHRPEHPIRAGRTPAREARSATTSRRSRGAGAPGSLPAEGPVDLGSHLVLGTGDGRAQVEMQISGFHAETVPEPLDSRLDDSGRHPPPTGVQHGHGSASLGHEEDRNAVGDGDRQEHARLARHVPVGRGHQVEPRRSPSWNRRPAPWTWRAWTTVSAAHALPKRLPRFQRRPGGCIRPQRRKSGPGGGPLDEPRERLLPVAANQGGEPARDAGNVGDAEGLGDASERPPSTWGAAFPDVARIGSCQADRKGRRRETGGAPSSRKERPGSASVQGRGTGRGRKDPRTGRGPRSGSTVPGAPGFKCGPARVASRKMP
jgi:hypothetical protein